jgi:hypothetical protein
MDLLAVLWGTFGTFLFFVFPIASVGFAGLVLAKAPRPLGVRIAVAAAVVAIGFAPVVLLYLAASQFPVGN